MLKITSFLSTIVSFALDGLGKRTGMHYKKEENQSYFTFLNALFYINVLALLVLGVENKEKMNMENKNF